MKSNVKRRDAGLAALLLLGVVATSALSATVGDQSSPASLGPQNGLMVYVEGKGAKMRILRQLPSTTTVSPPTTPPTTTTTTTSGQQPPVSSFTSTVSSATTVTPAPMQTTPEVNVSLAELRELDANGNRIKQNDSSFRSFDDMNFIITHLPDGHVIPNSKIRSTALEAESVLFPPSSGNVSIEACVTKDNGTVTLGDETMALAQGQLKVNFEVKLWPWCDGACAGSQSPARFLEADFVVQVANGRIVKESSRDQSYGHPKRFSLGKDAWADFSRKVFVDGSWRNLTDGYPQLSIANSRYVITVRLPRFNSSASYDVSFDPGYVASDKGGGPVGCAKVLIPQFYNLMLTSLSLVVVVKVIA